MIKRQLLLLFLMSAGIICEFASAQNTAKSAKVEIEYADSLIEIGKPQQASLIINRIINTTSDAANTLAAKILSAKILHENGKRIEAIELLQKILALPVIRLPKNAGLQAEAYLGLTECCYGMFRMERFKKTSDTVLLLSLQYHLPPFYRARAYANISRYYNYHTLVQQSKPYLDSAMALLSKAPAREKKYYKPVSIYTAAISCYRNLDPNKIFQAIDNAIMFIGKGYNGEKYNQMYLWRTIANAYFDRARWPDRKLNKKWYNKAKTGFSRAETILKQYYPENQIDLVFINNLCGLLNYYSGYYIIAQSKYESSEHILLSNHISPNTFAFIYVDTYLYGLKNIDSLFTGKKLFDIKKKELARWQAVAPCWQNWEANNELSELDFYRDIYSVNPYNIIVLICNDLYKYKQNKEYLEYALTAQEDSKCYFLKRKMVSKYSLNYPIQPSIKAIQQKLLPDQAVISFSDARSYINHLYAVIIKQDTASLVDIDLQKSVPINLSSLRNSDSACYSISAYKRFNYASYNVFFKPIRHLLGNRVKHLLIFPSTYSSYANFEMMVSDTLGISSFAALPYLYHTYQFTFDFSWQVAELRKQMPQSNKNSPVSLQMYVPDYNNTQYYQLPFFGKSSKVLKNKFDFAVFNNKKSTPYAYHANAGNAGILYIAGHCYNDDYFADNLKIILDSTNIGEERYLGPKKIIKTSLMADLTVLSLCEGGIGEFTTTDSHLNLPYWFAYAGSKSSLYSNWKLDDRSTTYIIERFFHYLAKGQKKSLSLIHAKEDYLAIVTTDDEKNPVYWGGLTLIGDDSPVNITEIQGGFYWYYTLFLLLPGIAFLVMMAVKSNYHSFLFAKRR